MSPIRKRLGAAVAASLLLLGAACGSDDEKASVVEVEATPAALQAAAERTADHDRYRMTVRTELDGPSGPMSTEMTMTVHGDRVAMTMDLASLARGIGGGAEVPGMPAEIQMIADGPVVYLQMPLPGSGSAPTWLKLDTSEVLPGMEDLAASAANRSPKGFLDQLQGAETVEQVGTEQIDGATTTHLKGTYTLRQAAEASGVRIEDLMAQTLGEGAGGKFGGAVSTELQAFIDELADRPMGFEVWIDGDGVVRRFVQDMDMTGLEIDGEEMPFGAVRVEGDLYDFGADDIDIEVPADAMDLGQLLGSLGG